MKRILSAFAVLIATATTSSAFAQTPLGTAFTYQGELKTSDSPADGLHDLRFQLFTAAVGGTPVGSTICVDAVDVVDGRFTVAIDFGAQFDGNQRFLQVFVRVDSTPGNCASGAYTQLNPRQPLTATPYALKVPGIDGFSLNAADGSPVDAVFVDNAGNVGVGTTTPQSRLHVAGGTAVFDRPNGAIRVTKILGQLSADDLGIWNRDVSGSQPFAIADWNTGTKGIFLNTASGKVGIGVTDPFFKLSTVASFPSDGMSISGSSPNCPAFSLGASGHGTSYLGMATDTDNFSSDAAPGDLILLSPQGKRLLLQNGNFGSALAIVAGNIGVGTVAPQAKLDVNGTARVEVLEITGADIAEKFPASEKLEPGMVVAIDRANAGQLCLARGAYNKCVAGVVSGANNFSVGAVLGNLPGHEDAPPIALSGRVYVHCDASTGAIEPGDMLTTSDTPGHAMTAADTSRLTGAVIGKAMSSLGQGERGLVLVLVNLQ